MPIPPLIPTSFVPKQPVKTSARQTRSGANILVLGSYFLLIAALIAAGGTFAYERYLTGVRDSRAATLAAAEENVDRQTVQELLRLRDRLAGAEGLLGKHVTLSTFFSLLETLTLQSIGFDSLKLSVADDRTAQVELSGTARTFNALAAESAAFASEKRIKRAIFSNIKLNKDGFVDFSLTADIDTSLVTGGSVLVAPAFPSEALQPQAPPPDDESAPPTP